MAENGSDNRALKSALTMALMIPALVALGAGLYIVLTGEENGFPLIAGGIVLVIFNTLVLKTMFSRLEEATEGEAKGPDID